MTEKFKTSNTDLYVRSKMPLYAQIATQFALKIENKEWSEGYQIPTISNLQKEYSLSRSTIREALQVIEAKGLISRRRGKGTFVNTNIPKRFTHQLPTNWSELISSLISINARLIAPIKEVDAKSLPDVLAGDLSEKYKYLQRVHDVEGTPYCLISIYLESTLFEKNPAEYMKNPVILVMAEKHPSIIKTAKQRVSFSVANEHTATSLNIALGAPVVEIHRLLCNNDNMTTVYTHARYPGEYVTMDLDLL